MRRVVAALRRVAMLVAHAVPTDELFAAATEEVGKLLGVDRSMLARLEPDGSTTILAESAENGDPMSSRADVVLPEAYDYAAISAPIIVEARPWGVMTAGARGIHPAVLVEEGIEPALGNLARRSPIPVELEVDTDGRLPEQVEMAIYYVVSESLTNIVKHADASCATVVVDGSDRLMRVSIGRRTPGATVDQRRHAPAHQLAALLMQLPDGAAKLAGLRLNPLTQRRLGRIEPDPRLARRERSGSPERYPNHASFKSPSRPAASRSCAALSAPASSSTAPNRHSSFARADSSATLLSANRTRSPPTV